MPLNPGARFGVYEITAHIGAGGMGEVYRARDTMLNRDVALKVLPDSFAADTERLARFRREARTLAALNHPHIAQIHGFEDADSTRAIVMEFVEGEDLAMRLKRGPIPIDEALAIARQIAEALEAAHDQSIVHRDLKPANIRVTPDGSVKVLDFGLAKPGGAGGEMISNSPTITTPAMTMQGVILGTAAYMSPEQAKGRPVDRRTDLWAFGCVLYEMLTGIKAFDGEDVTDILGAIVKTEPDWTRLPNAAAPAVRALLERCLQKERSRRLDSAAVARFEIDGSTGELPPATRISAFSRRARLAHSVTHRETRDPRFQQRLPARSVASPHLQPRARLETPFFERNARLSPDGRWLAFDSDRSGQVEVYVRPFPAVNSAQFQISTTGGAGPIWNRNGQELFFIGNSKMMSVSIDAKNRMMTPGMPVELFDASPYFLFAGGGIAGTFDVAPDGRRFVMAKNIERPERDATVAPHMIVHVNWGRGLPAHQD